MQKIEKINTNLTSNIIFEPTENKEDDNLCKIYPLKSNIKLTFKENKKLATILKEEKKA